MFYLWLIGGTQYNPGALPWFWPHAGAGKAGGSSRSGPWKGNHPTSHDKRGTLDPPQTTRTENSSASLPASLYWRADTNWWLRPPLKLQGSSEAIFGKRWTWRKPRTNWPTAKCALSFGYSNQSQRRFLRNANNFNDIIYKGNRGKIRVSQNPEPLRGDLLLQHLTS